MLLDPTSVVVGIPMGARDEVPEPTTTVTKVTQLATLVHLDKIITEYMHIF